MTWAWFPFWQQSGGQKVAEPVLVLTVAPVPLTDEGVEVDMGAERPDVGGPVGRKTGRSRPCRSGRPASSYRQMHLIRMRDERGAEHWAVRDHAALHRQLTGTPALAVPRRRAVAGVNEQGPDELRGALTRVDHGHPGLLAVGRMR